MYRKPEIEITDFVDIITTSEYPKLSDGGENKETNWDPWF